MFKKLLVIFILVISGINLTYSAAPVINCVGMPGCEDSSLTDPIPPNDMSDNVGLELVSNIVGQLIQFVALIAVISLILSGMFFLFSNGDEEKAKRAKTWITWSLVGVILSISAWGIINMLNNIGIVLV